MKQENLIKILDKEKYYPLFKANDSRFDGKVFVGVSSTNIYCRPVCYARMPKKDNCTFYNSAAAAESEGYRPCLICRPELAPGFALSDASTQLAQNIMYQIEENGLYGQSLNELAYSLDISDRHLRRVFLSEYGVNPIQYLQTYKLLLAKSLLTDTNLSITDIAFSSGFNSIRRFNTLFKERYRMSPSKLKKEVKSELDNNQESITLLLGYRPPYEWDSILRFLENRLISGVEVVKDNKYYRTVSLEQNNKEYNGWLSVEHVKKKNSLALTISLSLLPVLSKILLRIKHLFDLECDPKEIESKLSSMNDIQENLFILGTRLPGSFDTFEMAIRAILNQLITVKAALTLTSRLVLNYGNEIKTPIAGLTHTFLTPSSIVDLKGSIENHLGPLGITKTKARAIQLLAQKIVNNEIVLNKNVDPEQEINKLLDLKGFGPWTVNYIAMRALGWSDVFLDSDHGIKKALAKFDQKQINVLSKQWKPWSSYATISLWNSL